MITEMVGPSRPSRVAALTTLVALAVAVITTSTSPSTAAGSRRAQPCEIGTPTAVLISEGDQRAADGRLLARWDLPEGAVWESSANPRSGAYGPFRAEVASRGVTTDPARILAASPTFNNRLVLARRARWVGPASCLEKSLYGLQHARVATFSEPTEFAAFVLRSHDRRTLRVYWYSVNRNGIGNASPLTDPVRADVTAGWRPVYALHSHPFHLTDATLNGIVSPSEPDAQFQLNMARSLGLLEARITNGVDTVRIPASAFPLFKSE